jgi:hypothetical protein
MLVLAFYEFWKGKINKYKIDNVMHTWMLNEGKLENV